MGVPRDLAPAGDQGAAGQLAVDPSQLVRAGRVRKLGWTVFSAAVVVTLGGVAFAIASVSPRGSLRWVTAALLIALIGGAWVLCAHAGGHAWFVPLPALVFAVLWAITVAGHGGGAAWWLLALSAAAAASAVAVASAALVQRLRTASLPPPTLRGADGVAVTALDPVGVVRVAGETWTATSLSGPLPAGAPVHVVRADGVRLAVWSEVGTVPDARALASDPVFPPEEARHEEEHQP